MRNIRTYDDDNSKGITAKKRAKKLRRIKDSR